MTWEEHDLLTDILDYTTLFYVISSKWLEASIESDSGMRFAM